MWEEKTPPPECEFWWLEASLFLVVWGAREEQFLTRCPVLAWTSPGCSWCRAQLVLPGPGAWCLVLFVTSLVLFQYSPTGALVQLGGVLALHVRHVVLRSLLPIEMEQLLGLPVMLDSSLLEKLDRAHHT